MHCWIVKLKEKECQLRCKGAGFNCIHYSLLSSDCGAFLMAGSQILPIRGEIQVRGFDGNWTVTARVRFSSYLHRTMAKNLLLSPLYVSKHYFRATALQTTTFTHAHSTTLGQLVLSFSNCVTISPKVACYVRFLALLTSFTTSLALQRC